MPLLILVAEDDPGTRLAVKDYLHQSGYSVLTAENGQQALGLAEQYLPHLIITDVLMPGGSGYDLIQEIRQRPHLRLVPVILLTARDSTNERIYGYQLGCDVYLPKPFELGELGAIVRNLLERSQLIQADWRAYVHQVEQATSPLPAPPSRPGATASPPHPPVTLPGMTATIEFTEREQEVLELLTEGWSNNQIGAHLHLSPRTIEKYVSSLLRKTETSNRAELVRFAVDHHLVG